MKRTFFIFTVMAMVAMTMSFVGCDKNETIEPNPMSQEEPPVTQLKSSKVYANYDAMMSVNYALMWTDNGGSYTDNSSYNPLYLNWVTPPNSDCANYVSQCIKAGNLQNDPTWYYTMNGTVVPNDPSDDTYSTTWQRVSELYDYLINKYYVSLTIAKNSYAIYSRMSRYHEGDLVFYYDKSANKFSHVTIVTSKSSNNLFICGHTANEKQASLRYYLDYVKPSEDYVVILHFL
jgi:hypothetical protein